MAEAITREAWLRIELDAAESYLARFADSEDPIERAQVVRRREEARAFREELGRLGGAPTLSFRLSGRGVEGHNAPVELVKEIIQTYGQIADEYGADVLVAPAEPGSHVIRLVTPAQGQLPTFDTFAEAADALIGLSPDLLKPGESLEQRAFSHAAELTSDTVRAIRRMMATLARLRVDAEVDLESSNRAAHVRIRRDAANDLDRILGDLAQASTDLEVRGVMRGFTTLGGQFEIEAEQVYKGRVPKALRAAADGIPLGSSVHAVIEQITTTYQSGESRIRFRLKAIDRDSEG